MSRDVRVYLFDIQEQCERIVRYVEGLDEAGWSKEERTQDAVLLGHRRQRGAGASSSGISAPEVAASVGSVRSLWLTRPRNANPRNLSPIDSLLGPAT